MNALYLIGSLRNKKVPELAKRLRKELGTDTEVFDDWYAAGPEADDCWKEYEKERGRTYQEALEGYAAKHVFDFDRYHLNRCTHALLVLPAGKSGHMEIMYATYGAGAKTAILLDPEDVRWDVMYQFVPTILESDKEVKEWMERTASPQNKNEETNTRSQMGFSITSRTPSQKSRGLVGRLRNSTTPAKTCTGIEANPPTIETKFSDT